MPEAITGFSKSNQSEDLLEEHVMEILRATPEQGQWLALVVTADRVKMSGGHQGGELSCCRAEWKPVS